MLWWNLNFCSLRMWDYTEICSICKYLTSSWKGEEICWLWNTSEKNIMFWHFWIRQFCFASLNQNESLHFSLIQGALKFCRRVFWMSFLWEPRGRQDAKKTPKANPHSPSFYLQQNKFYGLDLVQQCGGRLQGCRGFNIYLFYFSCP